MKYAPRLRHCAIVRKIGLVNSLEGFVGPHVAVDTAVLTVDDGRLCVLLLPASESFLMRLPGAILHRHETLEEAVLRSLSTKAGVRGLQPQQVHVFDAVDRDSRDRVLSVAFVDVVRRALLPADALIIGVDELEPLAFDHAAIISYATKIVRDAYRGAPDPRGLLEGAFTLRELRSVHEAVLGERLLPDTFRRAMLPGLVATGEMSREGRGRPAEMYRRVG